MLQKAGGAAEETKTMKGKPASPVSGGAHRMCPAHLRKTRLRLHSSVCVLYTEVIQVKKKKKNCGTVRQKFRKLCIMRAFY